MRHSSACWRPILAGVCAARPRGVRALSQVPSTSFIAGGPVFRAAGLAPPAGDELRRWHSLGELLLSERGLGESEAALRRVYHLALPIYFYLRGLHDRPRRTPSPAPARERAPPLMVGLQCMQGGGKTTLCEQLCALLAHEGPSAVQLSIDDFYLTHAELCRLERDRPDQPLLHGRGNPGTHDMPLMTSTLGALRGLSAGEVAAVPRYDKSAYSGAGDRAPRDAWPAVTGPVDLVLLEGWCLGFEPGPPPPPAGYEAVEGHLDEFAPVHAALDAFVVVKAREMHYVYEWREEAEAERRARGDGAMTQAEVRAFVDRYMPSYQRCLGRLYERGPLPADRTLRFTIDRSRSPVAG